MIDDGIDVNRVFRDAVIDGERENFCKHPVKAKELTVVAVVEQQGFDVRIE